MSVREQAMEELATWGKYLGAVSRVMVMLDKTGIGKLDGGLSLREWFGDCVEVTVWLHGSGGDALADVARKMAETCGKVEKSFNGERREMSLTATYQGVTLTLTSAPPATCTVEQYEVEVEVPAVEAQPAKPATTAKVKKYRLVGDCEPLLAKAAEAESETAT